jgi:aminomethyltransferase
MAVALIPSSLPALWDCTIAPRTAIAYTVRAGQYIQIIDVEGQQCSDFLAFALDDLTEELDSTVTRTLNGLAVPRVGLHGKYFSNRFRPLVEVIQDTCGRHDSFLLACTAKYYEEAGYPGHPSCSENFNLALAKYGIAPRKGWSAINFFFNTTASDDGRVTAGESWSRAGDYVLLQAKQDLLCASSACPDDIDPANGWRPTEIRVRIFAPEHNFPKAIAYRPTPHAPARLTQDSAFTSSIRQLTDDLVEYNGFWVPNSFAHLGVQAEYWALRERAVLIDLSALRKFDITGKNAFDLLQYAFSRDLTKLGVGQSAYGCLLNYHGGIVDDGIVFCLGANTYRYVGNCEQDQHWLEQLAQEHHWQVTIEHISDRLHNLALQGPRSRIILEQVLAIDPQWQISLSELGYFRFATGTIKRIPVLVSRTGYTGELGYELFVDPAYGAELWQILTAVGEKYGLTPMGMLALERARIEAGLLSAGREFDDLTSPYEAGIGWTVSLKKEQLIAKDTLLKLKEHPPKVTVGLVLDSNDIPCHCQPVYALGKAWRVGVITSGTFSPYCDRPIALAQLKPAYATPGTKVEVGFIDGKQRRIPATVGVMSPYDPEKLKVRG